MYNSLVINQVESYTHTHTHFHVLCVTGGQRITSVVISQSSTSLFLTGESCLSETCQVCQAGLPGNTGSFVSTLPALGLLSWTISLWSGIHSGAHISLTRYLPTLKLFIVVEHFCFSLFLHVIYPLLKHLITLPVIQSKCSCPL